MKTAVKVFLFFAIYAAAFAFGALYQHSVDRQDFLDHVEQIEHLTAASGAKCDEVITSCFESYKSLCGKD